ncbi:glutathione S-transferase family protein [Heyndrickxia acidicola]|uniref:Glutathione S-transferase C-terminal domain-containing protein n=1 Tax=Heyndrickxia acidicola TaxID=209389 RepID=A0ABU6MD69_9BACI|nr:glutathione S-transferase C-terminal domain-containing protein [Heyndrickxia acidicola]MED1202616.1 glutathione S-transferase C-terminal domain-containing protein [Heyndrickxia acidicola]
MEVSQENHELKSVPEKTNEFNEDGSFKRQKNQFSTPFGYEPGQLPVEGGRYRLLWSAACPWAHRSVIVRKILGLEAAISLGTASPIRPRLPRIDWEFSLDENEKDAVLGIQYMSEIYKKTDPEYAGRPTVPVIVDVKTQQVVNNDYSNLTNYFETVWAPFHKEHAPDLYPVHLREEIDELNAVIFQDINNGVYKCGFAKSQAAYDEAYEALFKRLDELENRLASRRFLFGDYITDSDVRLFTTLVRFDAAYYPVFKTNRNLIREFQHLWGYARDLFQTEGFGETTDFNAIKRHYHLSITISPDRKEEQILPKGPDESLWDTEHDRNALNQHDEKFLYTMNK